MSDDGLHYEATPGGGVRVQAAGVEVTISRDAIRRAEQEGGLGFNLALTPEEHEALDRLGGGFGELGSPIERLLNIHVQADPKDP